MNFSSSQQALISGEHRQLVAHIREMHGESELASYIRHNMEQILLHYISCRWAACYMTKFEDLIRPYFDDVPLLDRMLRSDIIENRPNVIIGRTGAKIFPLLLSELKKCMCRKIGDYLEQEFNF